MTGGGACTSAHLPGVGDHVASSQRLNARYRAVRYALAVARPVASGKTMGAIVARPAAERGKGVRRPASVGFQFLSLRQLNQRVRVAPASMPNPIRQSCGIYGVG
jgi:hypothetical protein